MRLALRVLVFVFVLLFFVHDSVFVLFLLLLLAFVFAQHHQFSFCLLGFFLVLLQLLCHLDAFTVS